MEATRAANRQRVLLGHLRQVGKSVLILRVQEERRGKREGAKRKTNAIIVDVGALDCFASSHSRFTRSLLLFSTLLDRPTAPLACR